VREESKDDALTRIHKIALTAWRAESNEPGARVPTIKLATDPGDGRGSEDAYVVSRAAIIPHPAARETVRSRARSEVLEEKLKAIAQVLAAYEVLDRLSVKRQERLLRALYEILTAPEE
jgi:hypothetical protein